MNNRMESRKEILEDAHEGHEGHHPDVAVSESYTPYWRRNLGQGYGDLGLVIKWPISGRAMMGFLVTLIGLAVALVICIWLVWLYLGK